MRLRPVFSWALDREVIEVNPAAGVRMPAPASVRDRVLDAVDRTFSF